MVNKETEFMNIFVIVLLWRLKKDHHKYHMMSMTGLKRHSTLSQRQRLFPIVYTRHTARPRNYPDKITVCHVHRAKSKLCVHPPNAVEHLASTQ